MFRNLFLLLVKSLYDWFERSNLYGAVIKHTLHSFTCFSTLKITSHRVKWEKERERGGGGAAEEGEERRCRQEKWDGRDRLYFLKQLEPRKSALIRLIAYFIPRILGQSLLKQFHTFRVFSTC